MWFFLLILVIVAVPLWLLCLKFGAGALEPTGFGAQPEEHRDEDARIIAAIVVTFVGVLGGGYLVVSDTIAVDAVENLVAGIVGLAIGYWFR